MAAFTYGVKGSTERSASWHFPPGKKGKKTTCSLQTHGAGGEPTGPGIPKLQFYSSSAAVQQPVSLGSPPRLTKPQGQRAVGSSLGP
jgi:hypothetical protein